MTRLRLPLAFRPPFGTKTLRRKVWLACSVGALSLTGLGPAQAQDDSGPIPYSQLSDQPDTGTTARPYVPSILSAADSALLEQALQAVKTGNFAQADSLAKGLTDPVARKIVTWTIINNNGGIYSFAALDAARRDLWGWPRAANRQIAAERLIAASGMTDQQIVDWFKGAPPQSIEGATALITAYGNLGRTSEAQSLAKIWWRTQVFDSIAQANFYQAFSRYLTAADNLARINCLMLDTQNASSQSITDMIAYVDAHTGDVARAVIAMRSSSAAADGLYQTALASDPHNPVLAYARARYLSGKGLEPLGFPLLPDLPPASMSPGAASQLYRLRLAYFRAALKVQDYRTAYNAMNGGGFDGGEAEAEAEFFAGWMALIKLNDPDAAICHFQGVAEAGTSPITQGRADYWLGRAYEARNHPATATEVSDADTARAWYQKGAQYIYAFYGQMAAEKAGVTQISLGKDPVPSAADKARFENREQVKAARILGGLGEMGLFHAIIFDLDTVLPNAEEEALLVDLTASYDSQAMAMKVARMSMQRGFYLPERAYPIRDVPNVPGPEKAFVLAITRQESGFDPSVRSPANAKGMMQLIPSTARAVANRLNLGFSDSRLYDADYNMTLGTYHLGELVDRFGGSYILAAAGYNAGPSRMGQWIAQCGEPRGPGADALSFIECMPLGETRDYMMRVTENMRIYRARLNGGTAPLTATADVTRGSPAPIGSFDPDDVGDGSDTPDAPISYMDYQKAQTQDATAAAALTAAPVSMKPIADPKPKARPVAAHRTEARRRTGTKHKAVKTHRTEKKSVKSKTKSKSKAKAASHHKRR
ncbi:lytic transglycosylase domain-containing protein [Asticcacaulis sp. EMRT-3]|uniref:lytic transglycosylase domain-containing protein n=1 Tax=Asticcacaulis sp. EMRT-3 TaxID=3040349 RepID=UPI0024B000F7|nr:lytic transglycosylase domain-containing protein [Asticcacaulis sp. EMRT-3]MDI7774357.1 lytic transglycosylase domain-containing protein [Asticcacaulis sp. EMRT-3]